MLVFLFDIEGAHQQHAQHPLHLLVVVFPVRGAAIGLDLAPLNVEVDELERHILGADERD